MVLWSGRVARWSAASLYAVGIVGAPPRLHDCRRALYPQSGHLLAPQHLSNRAMNCIVHCEKAANLFAVSPP